MSSTYFGALLIRELESPLFQLVGVAFPDKFTQVPESGFGHWTELPYNDEEGRTSFRSIIDE